MKKKKIYISGAITGLYLPDALKNFENAVKEVEQMGHEAVNPMELVKKQEGWDWNDYMKADIKILIECDGIYMLDNWEDSKGAKVERELAIGLGFIDLYQEEFNKIKQK